ncbi:TRAP transporter substrate-binding protein [Chloroflexota bacterium]
MKKLGVIISLLLIFSFLPGLISCAQTPTSPTTPTTPTTTPTTPTTMPTEKPFKPIKLKWADSKPNKPGWFGTMGEATGTLMSVEAVTDGRIVFDHYPNQTLCKREAIDDAVTHGIADLGGISRAYGQLPLLDVTNMPTLKGETDIENNMIYWFKLHDILDKDFAAVNQLLISGFCHSSKDSNIFTTRKPLYGMDDLKGTTLLWNMKIILDLLARSGSVVVPMSPTMAYDALAKGLADGGPWNWEGPFIFGWVEVAKPGYWIDVGGVMNSMTYLCINREVHDSLPQDLQEQLDFLAWRWNGVHRTMHINASTPLFMKQAEEAGHEFITWSDEEKAKFTTQKLAAVDRWVEDIEKEYRRGAEAAELVKIYKDALDEYVSPAMVPVEIQVGGDQAEWDAVFGPGSTWGMGYKAYPNQIGLHELEGDVFQPW